MVSQLAKAGIDYVALGHIHRYQDRNDGASPPVVYSGSIECVSFKEWDTPKGFVLVTIETKNDTKDTQFQFIETPYRPFIAIHLDVREAEDPTAEILKEIGRHSIDDAIVRIRYQIQESRIADIDLSQIREALENVHVIASIERITEPLERKRKTVVTKDSSLEEALRLYISQHDPVDPLPVLCIAQHQESGSYQWRLLICKPQPG